MENKPLTVEIQAALEQATAESDALTHAWIAVLQARAGEIRGVSIDLSPDLWPPELSEDGHWSVEQLEDWGDRNNVRFPWTLTNRQDDETVWVGHGDRICVREARNISDATAMSPEIDVLVFGFFITVKKAGIPPIDFDDPLRVHAGFGVGLEGSEVRWPLLFERQNQALVNASLSAAEKEAWRLAAQKQTALTLSLNALLGQLAPAMRVLEQREPQLAASMISKPEDLWLLLDAAVAYGYAVREAEVRARLGVMRIGAARSKVSSETAQLLADRNKADADLWRLPALNEAIQLRSRHKNWGQKRLATEISEKLLPKLALGHTPAFDTIVAQIRTWEKDGCLPRSTSNQRDYSV